MTKKTTEAQMDYLIGNLKTKNGFKDYKKDLTNIINEKRKHLDLH